MGIRSLHRRLGRLAEGAGLRRCPCGAALPPGLCRPTRVAITEGYRPPQCLAAVLPQATPAEAQELEALLNRGLELHPDLAGRRGTSHQIYGGEPSDSALLRFRFADAGAAGPRCPRCGRAVATGAAITRVHLAAPPPDAWPDALRRDADAAARFAELTALLQGRAGRPAEAPPRPEREAAGAADSCGPGCPPEAVVVYRQDGYDGEPVRDEGQPPPAPCPRCGRPARVLPLGGDLRPGLLRQRRAAREVKA